MVKKPLPAQEAQVRSRGWEDLLEEEMATPLVFLPGESHDQRSLAGYSPWGRNRADTAASFCPTTETYIVKHLLSSKN